MASNAPQVSVFESAIVVRVEPGYLLASLYERIGGRLRFFGRGAALGIAAEHDHAEALAQALSHIQSATGRRLLRNNMPILPRTTDGRGVDTIVAVVRSANRPLRWSVVSTGQRPHPGLVEQIALVAGAPPVGVVGLGADEIKRPVTAAQRVGELFAQPIDALIVLHDSGTRIDEAQQQALLMIGASLYVIGEAGGDAGPACLLGIDSESLTRIGPLLGERARRIPLGGLVGRDGSFDADRLADAFAPLHAQAAPSDLGGIERLRGWLEAAPVFVRDVNQRAAVAAGHIAGGAVRLLDCALPPDLVEANGPRARGLSARLGAAVLPHGDALASDAAPAVLRAAAPWTVATEPAEVLADAWRIRAMLGELALPTAPLAGLAITATPVLGERGNAAAALTGLTAAGVPGVYGLWNDASGALTDAAAISVVNAQAGDEILSGALTRLGTAVVASAGGAGALRVDVHHPEGYRVALEVPDGELEVFPLEPNVPARIQVRPSGRQDLGAGAGRSVDVSVRGGETGLVIDNRASAAGPADGAAAARWIRALRGLAPRLGRPPAVARA